MKTLANLSIRNKLIGIILISTVTSVMAGFLLVIFRSVNLFQDELVETTGIVARVVSYEAALNMVFEQPEAVEDAMSRTREIRATVAAYMLDNDGEVYATWVNPNALAPPQPVPAAIPDEDFYEIRDGYLHYFVAAYGGDRNWKGEGEPPSLRHGTFYLQITTEEYKQQVRSYLLDMLGLMAFVTFAAGGIAFFLQGFISNPILHLAQVAQRVSDEADYSLRVPTPGRDEIGQLYNGFNKMLEQIQLRQEELERSNRDLDQFAYVASHDLKAPLRAISTLSGWIEEDLGEKLSPEAGEQMKLLRSRVKRMDGLIDGILQYSRAGRMNREGEEVDTADLVQEVVDLIDPPHTFEVIISSDMPTLTTKRLRLEQIFSNLINNAIKYHHTKEGRIEVSARRRGEFFEFAVKDDGPGIAPEHHDRVFMMFQTLQPRDQVESTGLGLSLVKKLVEEEGGTIRLDSKAGSGATFRFTWPADPDAEPEGQMRA